MTQPEKTQLGKFEAIARNVEAQEGYSRWDDGLRTVAAQKVAPEPEQPE